ncbi:wax ester/triacylglycerol synthase domain-containing protein [Sinomonas humi]|uniref:wax ester/triacylglycerol synthase domain-containing protein n=1 Tax=Sinomonas humi TaxID=1338436 RepID=UPI00068D64BC|nr:wax ester/triacylglycerol synthase domain-containing protein [Sinomonas humi]
MPNPTGFLNEGRVSAEDGAVRRVLTISANMGGGHNATAAGLEEAVRGLWPGSEIRRLDTLDDLLGPPVGSLFRRIYVTSVEKAPTLYEFFYSALWRHRWFARASKGFTGVWCGSRLAPHIDGFDPDLILSTYPLGSSGLAWLRRHRGLSVPSAAWISDFAPHPFWVYRDLDVNFVMHEVAEPHARSADPGSEVQVCAPPVISAFSPGDKHDARRRLGLGSDAFVVLVTAGAYAFGDVVATVRALLAAAPEVQVVAACGRNAVTLARLEGLGIPRERLVALGWTSEMEDYVRSADLVLTNAGGASALEALACDRPLLMCRPIAAHGAANAQLMVVSGLADICADEERLVDYIRTGVADRETFETLERNASKHRQERDLHSALTGLVEPRATPPAVDRPWPLRPADAFFAHVETTGVRQEIGAVLALDPLEPGRALDVETLRSDLGPRARGLAPLRRRLVRGRRAGWLLEESLDISRHVSECVLAPGAGDAEVDDTVDRFWSVPLPEDRPGWQMLLVRGQPGGKAVLAVKMHHALGDGVSALGLLDRLLAADGGDPLPERGEAAKPLAARRSAGRSPTGQGGDRLSSLGKAAGKAALGLWSLASRGTAPRHPLNRDAVSKSERQFVPVALPRDTLRAAARSLHAQPHEVALSVIADALSRLLADRALLLGDTPLRVMVPMAMRAPRLDRIFGNWTGSLALDLPMGPMEPSRRVAAVRNGLRRQIERGEPAAAQLVMQIAGKLPAAVHGGFARLVYNRRFFNSIVTYMPGARGPRWCGGARVTAMYPVLPLTEGVPITVGAVLAADTVGVGVLSDPALGLDRGLVQEALRAALEDALNDAGSTHDDVGTQSAASSAAG